MDNQLVKPIILIIENSTSTDNHLNELEDSYTVIHSSNSKEGFVLAGKCKPSLIILESSLSPIGGYELCKKFKSDDCLKRIPIMFNIGHTENFDPCFILELGAIDYMTHPIDINILRAKVQNFIRLYYSFIELEKEVKLARELNPNTALPGNTSIVNHIYAALHHDEDLTLVYTDLDNFKSFNDNFGFAKGDQVIQLTAKIIQDALMNVTGFKFLGHIGGDDFVFIASRTQMNQITQTIINDFDEAVKHYYTTEDINRGYIISKSRQGKRVKQPIVSISMGGVDLCYYTKDTRFEEISDICSEVKNYAKSFPGSIYKLDRRSKDNLLVFKEKAN